MLVERFVNYSIISTMQTRYEQAFGMRGVLVNLLSDYIRMDYENLSTQELRDFAPFVAALRVAVCTDLVFSASNSMSVWDSVTTPFGNTRRLSRFGRWLEEVVRYHNGLSQDAIESIVLSARQKVG